MCYSEIIESGYMAKHDYNCAETMLRAGNESFDLGLDEHALKVACPFGGGMGVEGACGALTGGLMVLGCLFGTDRAHADPRMTKIRDRYVREFTERFGSTECAPIKERHRHPDNGCQPVVAGAAVIIERLASGSTG